MTIASLEQAKRRVTEGQRQIARQRKVVAGPKRRRTPGNSESLRETLRRCKHWNSPTALTSPIAPSASGPYRTAISFDPMESLPGRVALIFEGETAPEGRQLLYRSRSGPKRVSRFRAWASSLQIY
jgi:hypothetical protein